MIRNIRLNAERTGYGMKMRKTGLLLATILLLVAMTASAMAAGYTTLRYRDEGRAVQEMQVALKELGYSTGGTDGKFRADPGGIPHGEGDRYHLLPLLTLGGEVSGDVGDQHEVTVDLDELCGKLSVCHCKNSVFTVFTVCIGYVNSTAVIYRIVF